MPAYRKAVVTGGAGFIGSHIAQDLIENGVKVTVLDDLSMGKITNIPARARFIKGNIMDNAAIARAFAGADILFHEAARVSIRNSVKEPLDDAQINFLGTLKAVEAARKFKIKKIVYASSMAVYGNAVKLPINENHPTEPTSPYGIAKLAGEKYVLQMGALYGIDTVALRYFNTFGTRQTLTPYVGVITIFINALLAGKVPTIFGSGKQVRDFVSVLDIAQANMLAMKKSIKQGIFNVGTGKGMSVNDVARLLVKRINPKLKLKHGPLQAGEPSSSIADISRIKKELGYRPRWTLQDKIDDIIRWNSRSR